MEKINKFKDGVWCKSLAVFFLLAQIFISDALWASSKKTLSKLTIFCEPNMVYALTAAARDYSKNKNVAVSIIFNASSELIENIDAGEPDDIFISSHPLWIENLKQKGLVDVYNLSNIAQDKLVLITSNKNSKITNDFIKDSDNTKKILENINNAKIPLIIASELSSLGRYTNELIRNSNIWDQRLYRKVNEDKKSVIDFVNENPEHCGIVLASEIHNHDGIRILKTIPDIDIYYQGLVIAGDNMEKARDFLQYLKSEKAKKTLMDNGLIVEK